METEMGWSSNFCKVTGNNICNFVKRFLPQTYALTTWIILPSVVLFLLPKYYMDLVYFILIIAYLFVFLIYFSENIGAILSKLKRDSFVIPGMLKPSDSEFVNRIVDEVTKISIGETNLNPYSIGETNLNPYLKH